MIKVPIEGQPGWTRLQVRASADDRDTVEDLSSISVQGRCLRSAPSDPIDGIFGRLLDPRNVETWYITGGPKLKEHQEHMDKFDQQMGADDDVAVAVPEVAGSADDNQEMTPQCVQPRAHSDSTIEKIMEKLWLRKTHPGNTGGTTQLSKVQFEALDQEIQRRLGEGVFEIDANLKYDYRPRGCYIKIGINRVSKDELDEDIHLFRFHSGEVVNGMKWAGATTEERVFRTSPMHGMEEPMEVHVTFTLKERHQEPLETLEVRWNTDEFVGKSISMSDIDVQVYRYEMMFPRKIHYADSQG